MFKLKSANNDDLEISKLAMKQSKTLFTMVENLGITPGTEDQTIPLDNVKTDILKLVIEFCEHYKNEPIRDEELEDEALKTVELSEWDTNFLQISNDVLFDLICAANFLHIPKLMNVSCKSVALMARGKSTEELRVLFGIETNEEDEEKRQAKTSGKGNGSSGENGGSEPSMDSA